MGVKAGGVAKAVIDNKGIYGDKGGGEATAVIDRLGAGTAVAMGTALGAVAEQRDGGGGGEGAILGHFGAFWGVFSEFGEFGGIWGDFGQF